MQWQFQSTPSWRGRLVLYIYRWGYVIDFNPRPREEGDLTTITVILTVINFNPRPREEGDRPPTIYYLILATISIHALVKRATIHGGNVKGTKRNFNPRPREEGDYGCFYSFQADIYFNPRPREEGDEIGTLFNSRDFIFQSTPSWRGRHERKGL